MVVISACIQVKEIGKVNMISNRNIETSQHYKVISTYAGGSKNELKNSRAKTIQDAVDETVKKIPGGEYLMNATIYLAQHRNDYYFAVQGDVWGLANQEITFRGFKKDDKVQWKNSNYNQLMKKEKKYLTGIITSLKDDKTCYVQDENGKQHEMNYDDITKIQ